VTKGMLAVTVGAGAALLAAALVVSSCGGKTDDVGASGGGARKLPMDGFKDVCAAEAIYSATGHDKSALAQQGEKLAKEYRAGNSCISCHEVAGSMAILGPKLTDAAERYVRAFGGDELRTRVWLHNKISDSAGTPGLNTGRYVSVAMPKFGGLYQPNEIEAMVEYLMSLKPPAGTAAETAPPSAPTK
jgi:mono/diheme cytochrome c family protein